MSILRDHVVRAAFSLYTRTQHRPRRPALTRLKNHVTTLAFPFLCSVYLFFTFLVGKEVLFLTDQRQTDIVCW